MHPEPADALHGPTPSLSRVSARTTTPHVRQADLRSADSNRVPEPCAPRAPLAVDVSSLDFGVCPSGSRRRVEAIGAKTVTVANNTDSTVPCVWIAPPGPFSVTPTAATLEPHTTQAFQVSPVRLSLSISYRPLFSMIWSILVISIDLHLIPIACSPAVRLQPLVCWHPAEWQVTFMPPLPDTAYAAELDCFLGHSDPAALGHHALAVVGHTLPAAHLPKLALSSNELRLPPCHVGRTAFAALRLSNVV